jgi:hypothetical protein
MPCYKILGIYSFAETLKKVHINDPIVLKKEQYNIKSKNAIGVYTHDNKKLGYLPNENYDEIKNFNSAYKISKLVLNQDYPILEISRVFPSINYLDNIEYPFEKKIKYEYKLVPITKDLEKAVISLEKYLSTKRIKVKRSAVIYFDENYVNLLLEVTKGIEQFQTVTIKYFKENQDKYEELYENELIDNTFYRELLIYRLESYYENNYSPILNYPKINYTDYLINDKVIYEPLELEYKEIDIILLVKLYLRYLLTNNDYFILKYINNFLLKSKNEINKTMKKLIPNYKILNKFKEDYNLELGKFTYDHKLKIYDYIDFTNDDTVFIIANNFEPNYLYTAYLTKKTNLILYNPIEGSILQINNIIMN